MDLFIRQFVVGVAAYGLAAGSLAFLIAWLTLRRKRRPTRGTLLAAFVSGVVAYTALSPLVADTPAEFREGNTWFIFAVMFVVAGGVILVGPTRRPKRPD